MTLPPNNKVMAPSQDEAVAARPLPFEQMFAALPMPAILQDEDFRFVAVNKAFERLTGYSRDELVGQQSLFLQHPDDVDSVLSVRARLRAKGPPPAAVPRRIVIRDGHVLHVKVNTTQLRDGERSFLLVAIEDQQDVHEREQVLLDRAELFRVLFEDSPVAMLVQDENFRIIRVNRRFCEWTGYPAERFVGRDLIDWYAPALQESANSERRAFRASPGEATMRVYRELRDASDRLLKFMLNANAASTADGRRLYVCAVVDLTEQRRMASEMQRQAVRFVRAFEDAPVGMAVMDRDGKVVQVNKAFASLTGQSTDSVRGQPLALEAVGPRGEWIDPEVVEAGRSHRRVRIVRPDGSHAWLDEVSREMESIGGDRVRVSVLTDVTREQSLHDELQDMVLQQAVLLRSMNAGLAHAMGEIVVQVNPVLPTMIGLDASQVLGQPFEAVFGGEAFWSRIRPAADVALAAGKAYRHELQMRINDSAERFFDLAIRRVDSSRPDLGLILTLSDVTELRLQADELRRTVSELHALIDNEAVGIAYLSAGRIERHNRRMATMLGVSEDALAGQAFGAFLTPAEGGSDASVPMPDAGLGMRHLWRADGSAVVCLVHFGRIEALGADAAIVVAMDVTDREAARSQAAATQARFDAFSRLLNDAVFVIEPDGSAGLFANVHFRWILGIDVDLFMSGPDQAWDKLGPKAAAQLREAIDGARSGEPRELDVDFIHPERGDRTVRIRLFRDIRGSGDLYGLAEDVTTYRVLERQRLEDALAQRDVLVREVHHRIKNNLQGVAGLLQQTASRRPEVAELLGEVAAQIQAIAQIHGLQIHARVPRCRPRGCCRRSGTGLVSTYGAGVEIVPDMAEEVMWAVPEQEAVPLALVLNELMTNAIKHRSGGRVTVSLRPHAEGFRIVIENAGELLPASISTARHHRRMDSAWSRPCFRAGELGSASTRTRDG
ncbi:MAG: PAS domain S-box protein [Burkholderiaceae bacterium]